MKALVLLKSFVVSLVVSVSFVLILVLLGNVGVPHLGPVFFSSGMPLASLLLSFIPSISGSLATVFTFLVACFQLFIVVFAGCYWFMTRPRGLFHSKTICC